ncbi:MAG: AEC family transporter [Candidatus Bathyarchaeota archaeon]|nr:MAG: AEC family transporter [Candidatus Bathyarchaeota archaeon]
MSQLIVETVLPILLLIGLGVLSRKLGVLKSGDERIFSAYVYYFALPALFLVNIAEVTFSSEILTFILAGIAPIFLALMIFLIFHFLIRLRKNTLYLLILSTIFGSVAFFGIPFATFAYPVEGEHLATLSAASIAIFSVPISLIILELYKLEESPKREGIRQVVRRLSRNPLIISISSGILLSLLGLRIPTTISNSLHLLGSTTSTMAIFMLGVFFYGRKYTNMFKAFELSLLRIVFLPTLALLITRLLNVTGVKGSVLVLMHSMPIAISMIILSERYNFYKEIIASVILISSLGAVVYLNLWLLLL